MQSTDFTQYIISWSVLRFYVLGHDKMHFVLSRSLNEVNTTSDEQVHLTYYLVSLFI